VTPFAFGNRADPRPGRSSRRTREKRHAKSRNFNETSPRIEEWLATAQINPAKSRGKVAIESRNRKSQSKIAIEDEQWRANRPAPRRLSCIVQADRRIKRQPSHGLPVLRHDRFFGLFRRICGWIQSGFTNGFSHGLVQIAAIGLSPVSGIFSGVGSCVE
jgi:hypothetical protein